MKRKILIILLALATVFFCTFGLAACGNNTQTHEHYYIESTVAPTCTEQGYTLHKCECGDEYKDNYTNALGHDIVHHERQAATCTQSGWADYDACTRCDYSTYSELKPNGHSYENLICIICGQHKQPSTLLEYTLSSGATSYTVSGIGIETDTEIVIASEYNGKPVTSIGERAFYNCSGLTSVTIPDNVTTIGDRAFYGCSGLTSVTIGNSVTLIDKRAFYGCRRLTSVTIPNNVTTIGEGAFTYCSRLTSLTIGNGVTSIGEGAFYGCSGLTGELTIPDGVASIGEDAFYGCNGLTGELTFPDGVTTIGSSAFAGCSGLTSVTIPDSVTSIGSFAFSGCSGLTSAIIPANATKYIPKTNLKFVTITSGDIGESAFYGCSGLTSVAIGDGVTSIGRYAFSNTGYYNDESNWQDGVLYIGKHLIVAKTSISGNYYIKQGTLIIGNYAFYNCSGLTSVTIPDSVTEIVDRAFYGCSGLTSVTIPDSVTTIGESAFSGCSGLTSVTIPDSVTEIGDRAFYGCSRLTSITIPDGVTSIGKSAFYNCSGLTSVTIPDSVTSIGDYAFWGCRGLTDIYFGGTITQWNAISKGSSWNSGTGSYTIHCTDGDISKS